MKCENNERTQTLLRLDVSADKVEAKPNRPQQEPMARKAVVPGQRYGMLTAESVSVEAGKYRTLWKCKCDCGANTIVRAAYLMEGHTKSCGCYRRLWTGEHQKKHGHAYKGKVSSEYRTWQMMRARCKDVKCKDFQNYGGRGIRVCEEWDRSFSAFLKDMGLKPKGMSIDRIDNNKNYEPGNCRWATRQEQNSNTRANQFITFNGLTLTHAQWERKMDLGEGRIYARLKRGWTEQEALTTPR
jgi:hypothetical protein